MLQLRHIPPSPVLSKVVQKFYVVQGNIPAGTSWRNNTLPAIMQSLIFSMNEGRQQLLIKGQEIEIEFPLILGQFTAHFESILWGELYYIGVHLSPTGLQQLLHTAVHPFANNAVPLASVLGERAIRLAKQAQEQASLEEKIACIEAFLLELLQQKANNRELDKIETATQLLLQQHGHMAIKEITSAVALSERNLQRYFLHYVGVSPKQFARIARFNAVSRLLEEKEVVNWQDIFDALGYFDQAHFVKDFKEITGVQPSVYYAHKTSYEKFFYGS